MGGNTALALLLTVGTNLAGIFTMPFVLAAVLGGGGAGVAIAPGPLLRALVQTILVPLLVGAAAHAFVPGRLLHRPVSPCVPVLGERAHARAQPWAPGLPLVQAILLPLFKGAAARAS